MSESPSYPRVFVTGATGFLGAHVVAQLIADGRAVVALVRDESSRAAAQLAALGATLARGDAARSSAARRARRSARAGRCA